MSGIMNMIQFYTRIFLGLKLIQSKLIRLPEFIINHDFLNVIFLNN